MNSAASDGNGRAAGLPTADATGFRIAVWATTGAGVVTADRGAGAVGPDDRGPEVRASETLSSSEPAARGIVCGRDDLGDPRRPAWKWSEKPGQVPEGRDALLTHDARRYEDEMVWREQRPELVMGPGSWGWVERAYASTRALFAPGKFEAAAVPVFIVGTEDDKLVSPKAIHAAAARLPHCELLMFGKEARHEVLREEDAVRDKVLGAIDDFLDRKVPRRD